MIIRHSVSMDINGKTIAQILELLTTYLTSLHYIEGKGIERIEITPSTLSVHYVEIEE